MLFNPDAAAASVVISTLGFENIKVSFDWGAFSANFNGFITGPDELFFVWSPAPAPSLRNENAWTSVAGFGPFSQAGGGNNEQVSAALGLAAANTSINIMFYSDVSRSSEGFFVDNVQLTGDAIMTTPLPAALPLFLAALGGLGIAARKKKAG